jgi:carbon monoxide dehydrogenase subunit G
MKLEHDFTVHAPLAQAWNVLLDVERVAPCLPGAALDGGDGTEFTGTMTVKLGPVTSRYRGTVRIEEADEAGRRAVLRAQGRDARGNGTAAATITTRLDEAADGTRVRVETDLAVSGPAAQFGRGVMQDVSGKLMRQFADCLAEELGSAATAVAVAAPAAVATSGGIAYEDTEVGRLPVGPAGDAALAAARATPARERRSPEVLDLGAASRAAVAKRAVPVLAAVALLAAAVAGYLRRRR